MRILFYLPVATPLWFERVVGPMLRALRGHAELHVLAPTLWRNTGISQQQLAQFADLADVHWHIVDAPGHESLRDAPEDPDGLAAFVEALAPDHVLCRAAETETAARFPARVRYIMEAGCPPFALDPWALVLHDMPFEHGAIPALDSDDRAALDAAFAPRWEAAHERFAHQRPFDLPRAEALALLGVPDDRPLIAVPLEYDHEENFFPIQHRFPANRDWVTHLLDHVPDSFTLAFTNHPLNVAHGRDAALREALRPYGARLHIASASEPGVNATNLLARHCDGMIVQNSKSYSAGAFFGKPMLRLSRQPSAAWLRMYEDLDDFLDALAAGRAVAADAADARSWFAWRIAGESFDAATIGGIELLDRLHTPVSPARWAAGLARFDQHQPRS